MTCVPVYAGSPRNGRGLVQDVSAIAPTTEVNLNQGGFDGRMDIDMDFNIGEEYANRTFRLATI
jgi:hypothetical protein